MAGAWHQFLIVAASTGYEVWVTGAAPEGSGRVWRYAGTYQSREGAERKGERLTAREQAS